LHKFEGKSSFSTWLTRIAINEALMWLRKKRASLEVPIGESSKKNETALPLDFLDLGPNPEDSCIQRERERIVSAAINKLTPTLRTAIKLRAIAELSTEETAGIMGLSIGTVKARLFHGRRKLQGILKQYAGSARTYGKEAMAVEPRGEWHLA
jgi:RNA polymerase sigma-70 factor (ECF subfamily)